MKEEIMELVYNLYRTLERQDVLIYQLITLLTEKGVITVQEYDKYCSIEVVNKKMELINKVLKEEEEEQND